ncbi:hypothetical protein [Microbacterium pygmaeum]|uniref:SipW-cognate class signal peptide n=1 Tax=Microbacterium pygmaeum TaxID=370764 RepID=A0A1G7ZR10_9MICO|nr:hypothetical protein [Microbacterium pygmaeum]SDH11119.1 hypothetical protein SAMN04489810_2138 [Microbacterium pygmaeum]
MTSAATIGAAVVLAVATAGGTYASLSAATPVAAGGTLRAGTTAISISSPLAVPTSALYPGRTVAGSGTVTNSGTTAVRLRVAGLALSSASNAFSSALVVGVSVVAAASACTVATTPQWTGSFASATPTELPTTLAVGASAVVCVQVSLPLSALADAGGKPAATFTVSIDGRQT